MEACSVCGFTNLSLLADFGTSPIAGEFSSFPHPRIQYRLASHICHSCCHSELSHKLTPQLLYGDKFSYVSSSSPGLHNYFRSIVCKISEFTSFKNESPSWLDIGSNDNSLLDIASDYGYVTYGIEPSKAFEVNSFSNHNIINDYATEEVFSQFSNAFSVISVLNTLSNTIDPLSILKLAANNLADDGFIIVSTGSLEQVVNGNFDYIYHEHNHYFSEQSLHRLAENAGLKIVYLDMSSEKGGSWLAFLVKSDHPFPSSQIRISRTWQWYKKLFDHSLNSYDAYIHGVIEHLSTLQYQFLSVFGASQSVTSYLLNSKLHEKIDFYVDDNPVKLLTYSPLGNKVVLSTPLMLELLRQHIPIACFLGAWRFDSIWINNWELQSYESLTILPNRQPTLI